MGLWGQVGSVGRRVANLRVLESMKPVRIDTFFYGQNCFSKCVAELDLNEHGVGGGLLNNLLFPISTYMYTVQEEEEITKILLLRY